jgi:hypothetical protein
MAACVLLLQTMETPAQCKAIYKQQLRTIRLQLERPLSVSPREQAFKDNVEQLHADMLQVLLQGWSLAFMRSAFQLE